MDIDHAERMRRFIADHNADLVVVNDKYVMQITGDNEEGKKELDNFTNPEEKYPVIATTSKLMTTGIDAQTCKVIVLDSNIQSMTEFKQIIGRGTRINEEFGKMYFTILDFRNVTDLFADPDFDGDPVRIKLATENDDLGEVEDEEESATSGEPYDREDEDLEWNETEAETIPGSGTFINRDNVKREKVYVNGVDVSVLISREMHFDHQGKPITVSLKDHTKQIIRNNYATLKDFLTKWNEADKKAAIIKELEAQGVLTQALQEAVNKEVDLFDLICHVAYDQPPLTRNERANNVKKRNYFTKYGEQAKNVLESLLDKYADEGIATIESTEVLSLHPFDDYGTPPEIIRMFGNRQNYLLAVKELEIQLYA